MSKIAIVLDTNIAHNPETDCGFDEFHIFEYDNTVAFVERHDLTEKVEVFLPEAVLDEITEHRRKKFDKELSGLSSTREKFLNTSICDIPQIDENFDRIKYLKKIKERKLKQQLNIIPVPSNKASLFDEIFKMALKKEPPFKQGKSDQGFKDAVILLSIIDFFKNNTEYDRVLLFSDDHGYDLIDIKKIQDIYKINLEIQKDLGVQDVLSSRFKLLMDLKQFIEENSLIGQLEDDINSGLITDPELSSILEASGSKISKFTIERYVLNEINDNECELICFGSFDIIKNTGEVSKRKKDSKILFKRKPDETWGVKFLTDVYAK